jgi:hypothetical protein
MIVRSSSGDAELVEAVGNYLELYVGNVKTVLHELKSPDIHLDIHIAGPTSERNFYTLMTSGMAEHPMVVPRQASGLEFAELMICLPPTWHMEQHAWGDPDSYWPLRMLKSLARYPHGQQTWLGYGHSVQIAGDRFSGVILLPPRTVIPDGFSFRAGERRVLVWGVFPLFRDELDYKREHGSEAIEELLYENEITELVQPSRASVLGLENVCRSKK